MVDECQNIPLPLLCNPRIVMRPVVKDSIEYLERRDSMARFGLTNSILTRPSPREPGKYEVVDGFWRFTVAQELCLDSLPCIIKAGLSDDDALALQIHANAVRAETTPIEFCRQLRRIIDSTGGKMTFSELARIAGKHPTWVKERMGLLKLPKDVQLMVDRGEIPVNSAYMLAKIHFAWRREYVQQALTMSSKEFCALAAGVIKQFSECVQQGRMEARNMPEFKPQHYMRGLKELKAELDSPKCGATVLAVEAAKTVMDGWNACLRWCLHLDQQSIEEQKRNAERKARSRFQTEAEAANEVIPEDEV